MSSLHHLLSSGKSGFPAPTSLDGMVHGRLQVREKSTLGSP